jgi:hypothetical protein
MLLIVKAFTEAAGPIVGCSRHQVTRRTLSRIVPRHAEIRRWRW